MRVLAVATIPVAADAAEYAVLGESILQGRGMWLPWGEYWELDVWRAGPSHHYPPVYPVYLTPFLAILGFSTAAVHAAAFAAGLALLALDYVAMTSLFGRVKAAWFVALLALDPVLVATTGTGYAENLVTLLFVATVASIVKSLERPRWILVAGLAAGLASLTKSSVGPFFLVAGLAGLAWRFRFAGTAALRDRAYLGAIGIFAALSAAWAARNLAWFWDGTVRTFWSAWQTSAWFSQATAAAFAHPLAFAGILAVRAPFYVALFLLVAAPWWRELRHLPILRDAAASALALAVGLTYVLAWLISGVLWVVERSPIFWADMGRYVVVATPVIGWMVALRCDPASASFRRRFAVAAAVLIAMNAAAFLTPQGGVFDAYRELRARAQEGDVVALQEVPKYEAAIHLAGTGVVLEPYGGGTDADYVLTTNVTRAYEGYRLLEVYGPTDDTVVLPGFRAALWARTA